MTKTIKHVVQTVFKDLKITHGVPSNIKYNNNFRYAINIRHPAINNDNNNENCNLYNSFKDTNIFKCKSSISIKPLKF